MIRVSVKSRGLKSITDLRNAKGTDAEALCNIDELDVTGNKIESLLADFSVNSASSASMSRSGSGSDVVSVLEPLRSLRKLELRRNELGRTNLLGLSVLRHCLTYLDVSANHLTSLSGLQEVTLLSYLNVSRNELKSLRYLPVLHDDGPGTFTLIASENQIGGPLLVSELRDTVGKRLLKIDLSLNKLESAAPLLPLIVPTRDVRLTKLVEPLWKRACQPDDSSTIDPESFDLSLVEFPKLADVTLDCNPLLINRSLERLVEDTMRHMIVKSFCLPEAIAATVDRCIAHGVTCQAFWHELLKLCGENGPSAAVNVSLRGRTEAEEQKWLSALRSRSVEVLRSAQATTQQRVPPATSPLQHALSVPAPTSRSSSASSLAARAGPGVDEFSHDSNAHNARGVGRVSSYSAAASAALADALQDDVPVVSSASSAAARTAGSFCSSTGIIDNSQLLAPPAKATFVSDAGSIAVAATSNSIMLDRAIEAQTVKSLRQENKALRKELEEQKRISREQLGLIRSLKDEQDKNLKAIEVLQDKLKRKMTEAQCNLQRAHDAEAAVTSLKEAQRYDGNSTAFHRDAFSMTTITDRSSHNNHTVQNLSAPLHQRKVFHLTDEERSRILEDRFLSNQLSASFTKEGVLLPGRYPHAHRTFMYAKDVPQDAEERQRYDRMVAKHRFENELSDEMQRAVIPGRAKQRTVASLHSKRTVHPLTEADDNDSASLAPHEEAVLFLSERVAQLEAMCKEQDSYCNDLAKENEEVLHKYESLVNKVAQDSSRVDEDRAEKSQ